MKQKNLDEFDLKDILKQCEKSALNGYNIASKHMNILNKTIDNAKIEIENTINDFNNSQTNHLQLSWLMLKSHLIHFL